MPLLLPFHQRYITSNKNFILVLWPLHTRPAYIPTLLQISNHYLEVAVTWTLLCHVYKAKFLYNSKVCNSINKNLIRILWSLCICRAYILTLPQASNHYLENCRWSCEIQTLLCHMNKTNFRYVTLWTIIWSELCDLYAQSIFYILTMVQVSNPSRKHTYIILTPLNPTFIQ